MKRHKRLMAFGNLKRPNQDWSAFKARLHKSYHVDEVLTRGYDWAASQSCDAFETAGETIIKALSFTTSEMIFFFTEIQRNDCGILILGRKGHKTRIQWHYSLRSIGQMSQGHADTLAEVDTEVVTDALKQQKSTEVNTPSESETALTISEAKRRLAQTFGVPANAIEITIRG